MEIVRRNVQNGNAKIERLIESKIIEADKNLLFSLGFESDFGHISEICDRIATGYIDDVKKIGRILLSNGYNPILQIKAELTSIDLSRDVGSKAPYSAVSVLRHNYESLKKMIAYSKRLISEDSVNRFDGIVEELNRVILKDIALLDIINDYIAV